jgi:Na+/melibiose symporter-like transporter
MLVAFLLGAIVISIFGILLIIAGANDGEGGAVLLGMICVALGIWMFIGVFSSTQQHHHHHHEHPAEHSHTSPDQ